MVGRRYGRTNRLRTNVEAAEGAVEQQRGDQAPGELEADRAQREDDRAPEGVPELGLLQDVAVVGEARPTSWPG